MNLISIRSPFQLLCAIEWLLESRSSDNYLIIRKNPIDSLSYQQILELIKDFRYLFNSIGTYGEFPDGSAKRIFSFVSKKEIDSLVYCQPSDFRNRFLYKITMPNVVVHVDDGTATYRSFSASGNFSIPKVKANEIFFFILKRPRFFFFSVRKIFSRPQKILVFTFFNKIDCLSHPKKTHGFYELSRNLEKKYWRKELSQGSSELWVIGSPYSEKSISGISLSTELEIICEAVSKLKILGFQVSYFPHRFDSKKKIDALVRRGLSIRYPVACLEVDALKQSPRPVGFAAIGSTALCSAKKILPFSACYRIESPKIPEDLKEEINVFYNGQDFLSL